MKDVRALVNRVAELETDGAALRKLLFAGAEIMDSCAHQVDLIFPDDAEPEMQESLRGFAKKFRVLSESEIGRVTGLDGMLARAAQEEREKKEQAEARVAELEGKGSHA